MRIERKMTWYVCGIMLLMFIGAICTTTQGMLLTDYIDHYELESFRQGYMSAFQSIGNILALFLIGIFIGKIKKASVLTLSAFLIPVVFFALHWKPPYIVLLLCYGLYGVAFGFLDSLASSIMVDVYHEDASKYMNVLHGVYGVGGLLGPVLLQFLSNVGLQWNDILAALCVLSLLAALLYAAVAYPIFKVQGRAAEGAGPLLLSDVLTFFREKRKQALLLCCFLYGAHQIGITVWTTRYISEYLYAPAFGPAALSLFWVGVTLSRLIITGFKFKPEKVVLCGHILSGLAIGIGVLVKNGLFMMICCGLSGFFEGAILPEALYISCSWTSKNTALGSSMVLIAHYIGFVITPPLIGAVIRSLGVAVGMSIPVICSFAAAAGALALMKYSKSSYEAA